MDTADEGSDKYSRMGGGEPVFTHLSIGLPKYPPAWAGMNLFHHQNTGSARRIPRMCGDEPHIMKVYRVRKPYSPHKQSNI